MIIKSQDEKSYDVYEIEWSDCTIKCKDNSDRRKKHTLGTYKNRKRTCEVFKEIDAQKTEYYEMPEV